MKLFVITVSDDFATSGHNYWKAVDTRKLIEVKLDEVSTEELRVYVERPNEQKQPKTKKMS